MLPRVWGGGPLCADWKEGHEVAYVEQYIISMGIRAQREISAELGAELGATGMSVSDKPFPEIPFWDDSMMEEEKRLLIVELRAARARIAELEAKYEHA